MPLVVSRQSLNEENRVRFWTSQYEMLKVALRQGFLRLLWYYSECQTTGASRNLYTYNRRYTIQTVDNVVK
jgi:hypothetical protein